MESKNTYSKEYYIKNKQKLLENNKKYYEKNKNKIIEYNKKMYLTKKQKKLIDEQNINKINDT